MTNSRYSLADLQILGRAANLTIYDLPPSLAPLSKSQVPNVTTDADELRAEQLILDTRSSKLVRKPSIPSKRRKLSWKFKTVTALLPAVVEDESAGTLQVLLREGGQDTSVKRADTRSSQQAERASLLLKASMLQVRKARSRC